MVYQEISSLKKFPVKHRFTCKLFFIRNEKKACVTKMARAFIFSVLLISLVTVAYATSESTELYDNRYDYVDIDGILSNDRIRNQYYKCYTNTGPCLTPDAKFFKGIVIFTLI